MIYVRWIAIVLLLSGTVASTVIHYTANDPIQLDGPVYGSWSRDKWTEYTSADYDSLALFDAVIMGHETLVGSQHDGLVDSVRVRNPDWIYLPYVFYYGCGREWETSFGFYKDLWDMIERNDFWMRDIYGEKVDHGPGFPHADLFNPGAKGLADSLAVFYLGWMEKRGNLKPGVGVFIDWLNAPYPGWAIDNDFHMVDFNRDGVPYADDPADENQNRRFMVEVAGAFRKYAPESFLLVPNGNAHRIPKVARLYDGGMHEEVRFYYPRTPDQWRQAINDVPGWLSSDRVNPPLVFWQSQADSIGYPSEAAAAVSGGVATWSDGEGNFVLPDRQLELGFPYAGPLWSGDTVRTRYAGPGGLSTVEIVAEPFIWPYLIRTDAGDTLSRGGGWPRQEPADALSRALDEYSDYLSDQYGLPVDLDHVSKWASTRAIIEATCDCQ